MQSEIRTKIQQELASIQDINKLFNIAKQLNISFKDTDFIQKPVWAKIKDVDTIVTAFGIIDKSNMEQGQLLHLLNNRNTRMFAAETQKIRLFFDGEYYINPELKLKLKAEWIDIIKE